MTVDFADYFWGEKNNGFDVLYHNMKHGALASKELADFLRERTSIEEYNYKALSKLAKQATGGGGGSNSGGGALQGTLSPIWSALRSAAEKLAGLHLQLAQRIAEMIKDVAKYSDELHKKHKSVKEEESSTLDVVQNIQNISVILQKTKDACLQKKNEYDRLKKDNASQRELEKAEVKFKKAQDEYKILVDKYTAIRNDFEAKMTQACRRFQDIEETHLRNMKDFLNTYADVLQSNHEQVGQIHIDFKRQCLDMTVDKLLEQFVQSKYTGFERPGIIEFEEVLANLADAPIQPSHQDRTVEVAKEAAAAASAALAPAAVLPAVPAATAPPAAAKSSGSANGETGVAGFLRSRREKRKEKKQAKKKRDSAESASNKEEKSDLSVNEEKDADSRKSGTPTPEVDEDGYCIKPKTHQDPWESGEKGGGGGGGGGGGSGFYSSSDTDSEEESNRKIRVEIKPLSNGGPPMSASVDELRATVENLSLSPAPTGRRGSSADSDHHLHMKRSQSVSQQIGAKPSSDLLNLFHHPSNSTPSSASTPTGGGMHPYAPLQSPTAGLGGSASPVPMVPPPPQSAPPHARFPEGDLFSELTDIIPALPPKQSTASLSSIAIPRPPSRRGDPTATMTRGRMSPATISPATISRADSVASLEFRTAGIGVGSSRGPSPLTLGLADAIPLAVAFHEIIHSYFRGSDESRCQVKLCGDMMLSFPAGIVAVLANNPSPTRLTFRLRNSARLERMVPNSQLISMDVTQGTPDSTYFEFNMGALTALLRRQAEQNPAASYFNVDILKYQIRTREGAASCPFQLVAYWKCNPSNTDLKIDYKYNSRGMANPTPLLNVQISVPIDGGFKTVQSKPNAQWLPDTNRLLWKFTELSQLTEGAGVGSLKARVELSRGPGSQGTIFTQFNCEGTTLSGVEFELAGPGYRVSLIKRRFVSGKYLCDGDVDLRTRYAAPPSSTE